jgi:hypothetical protein
MSAREPALQDRDWWTAHVLIAIFGVLVAAILVAVPGWSAPLHAWITLAAFVIGVLAGHAALRAGHSAWRRQGRAALLGGALAGGLGLAAAGLLLIGHWSRTAADDLFVETPAPTVKAAR